MTPVLTARWENINARCTEINRPGLQFKSAKKQSSCWGSALAGQFLCCPPFSPFLLSQVLRIHIHVFMWSTCTTMWVDIFNMKVLHRLLIAMDVHDNQVFSRVKERCMRRLLDTVFPLHEFDLKRVAYLPQELLWKMTYTLTYILFGVNNYDQQLAFTIWICEVHVQLCNSAFLM